LASSGRAESLRRWWRTSRTSRAPGRWRSLPRAQDFATRHELDRAYGSCTEGLADPDVYVLYVATPPAQHGATARAAVEAGKAMLVQKAFTETGAGARGRGPRPDWPNSGSRVDLSLVAAVLTLRPQEVGWACGLPLTQIVCTSKVCTTSPLACSSSATWVASPYPQPLPCCSGRT